MAADMGPIAAAAYPSPPNYSSSPHSKPSISSLYDKAAMSTSISPNPGGSAGQDKSPLSTLNLGFLKGLTEKRTTRGKHLSRSPSQYIAMSNVTADIQMDNKPSAEDRSLTASPPSRDDRS